MDEKRKECKLSIAAVDKYSSPLGIDVRLHPWGKEDWRISFLMRNELIGQVVQRNYITLKSYKKASDIFDKVEEKMLSFQDSIERGFVHSSLAIPQIGQFMNKIEDGESDYEQPDSASLRKRTEDTKSYDDDGIPDGLVIHDVEDHFPSHDGELEERPKPEKGKAAGVEEEIVEAQIEELDIKVSPIEDLIAQIDEEPKFEIKEIAEVQGAQEVQAEFEIEESLESEPDPEPESEFEIEETLEPDPEPEFEIEETLESGPEPEFEIEETLESDPEPEFEIEDSVEVEIKPEIAYEPEPGHLPLDELEMALASLENMFVKEAAEESEFSLEDLNEVDEEAEIEKKDIFVTLLASLGDLNNVILASPIKPEDSRNVIENDWFRPKEEVIDSDIYFEGEFDVEEGDMEVIDFNDPKYQRLDIPDMSMLESEALKYDTFEDFERAWLKETKHGIYWHVTDDPRFFIDPEMGPRDMSSLGMIESDPGRLMVTSDLETWAEHYGDVRRFAALIDMSGVPKQGYRQVNRGFGNEFYVNDPSEAKVLKVYPLDEALYIDSEYSENKPQNAKDLRALYDMAHRRNNSLHHKGSYVYKPLKYSEYNTPIRAKIGAIQEIEDDEISKVKFVIESLSFEKPDFDDIKRKIDDEEWFVRLVWLYNQNPQFCTQTYRELLSEMLNDEIVAFTGGMLKTSQEIIDTQEAPQETDLGPVSDVINVDQSRPNVEDFGADAGKADAAINLIQQSSFANVLNDINWIGISGDPGHFGVYETNLNGKGFRININRVNQEVEELLSEFEAQLEGIQIQDVTTDQANMLNQEYGGPNLTWESNDADINLGEAKEDIQVIILGEVMVHEATHAMGAEDEGAPTEAEKAFLREVIPAINQDRQNRGLIPLPIGVKGEDKTTVNEFIAAESERVVKESALDRDLPETVRNNPEVAEDLENLEDRYFPPEYAQDSEDIEDDMIQPGATGVAYVDDADGKVKGYLYGYDLVYEDNIEDLNLDLTQMICFVPMLCNISFMTFVSEIINKAKSGEIFYASNFIIDEAHRFRAKEIIVAFLDQLREKGYEYIAFDALSDTYKLLMRGDKPNEAREKSFGVKVIGSLPVGDDRSLFLMNI